MAKKYFTNQPEEVERFSFKCKCGKIATEENKVFDTKQDGIICLDCFLKF